MEKEGVEEGGNNVKQITMVEAKANHNGPWLNFEMG